MQLLCLLTLISKRKKCVNLDESITQLWGYNFVPNFVVAAVDFTAFLVPFFATTRVVAFLRFFAAASFAVSKGGAFFTLLAVI